VLVWCEPGSGPEVAERLDAPGAPAVRLAVADRGVTVS
jgi:hypothetical protein